MAKEKELEIKIIFNGKEIKYNLGEVKSGLENVKKEADGTFDGWKGGIVVLNQAIDLAERFFDTMSKPVKISGQWEQYLTTLRVMLGSLDIAKERFEEMVTFAAKTPFNVDQVIKAGNALQTVNRYSIDTLRMLGDLAAASGTGAEEAVSAYVNMVTGRTGIAVKQFRMMLISTEDWMREIGKKVLKTGEGTQATVTEMVEALPKIIQKKGFTNLMEEQSKTLLGRVSNMQDAVQRSMSQLGDQFINQAKEGIEWLTGVIETIGKYGEKTAGMVKLIAIEVATLFVIIKGGAALTGIINGVGGSFTRLFAILSAHPYMTVLSALTLVIGAVKAFNILSEKTVQIKADEALATREMIRDTINQTKGDMELATGKLALLQSYKKLKDEVSATNKPTEEYKERLQDMKNLYPGLVNTQDEFTMGNTDLEKEINKTKTAIDKYSASLSTLKVDLLNASISVIGLKADVEEYKAVMEAMGAFDSTVAKLYDSTVGVIPFMKDIRDELSEFIGEDYANQFKKKMTDIFSPLKDKRTFQDVYDTFKSSEKKLDEAIREYGEALSPVHQLGLKNALMAQYKAQMEIVRQDITKDSRTTMERVNDLIREEQTKAAEAGTDKALTVYKDWLTNALLELSDIKGVPSPILGVVTQWEKDSVPAIAKILNAEKEQADIRIRELKEEAKEKEKEDKKKREASLKEFEDRRKLLEMNLKMEKISFEEYKDQMGVVSADYNKYLQSLLSSGRKYSSSELSFAYDLNEITKNMTKPIIEQFEKRSTLLREQQEADGSFKESHIRDWEDLLEQYTAFIQKFGLNSLEELRFRNNIVKNIRDLNKKRADIDNEEYERMIKVREDEFKLTSLEISGRELPGLPADERDKERKRLLFEAEKVFLSDMALLHSLYASQLGLAVSEETDEQKKKREDSYDKQINITAEFLAKLKELTTKFNEENKKDTTNANVFGIDLGITESQFDNILERAKDMVGQLKNIFSDLYNYQVQKNKEAADNWEATKMREIDASRKSALAQARTQQQKDRINEEYNKKEEETRKEADKKRYESAKLWFELQKFASLAMVSINIAEAITKDYAKFGAVGGPIMQAINIAAGAAQAAVILSQKFPEGRYEKGGKVKGGRQIIEVNEKGEEFVVNANATAKHGDLLERINKGESPFVNYYDMMKNDSRNYGNNIKVIVGVERLEKKIGELNTLMNKYLQNPVPPKLEVTKKDSRSIVVNGLNALKTGS